MHAVEQTDSKISSVRGNSNIKSDLQTSDNNIYTKGSDSGNSDSEPEDTEDFLNELDDYSFLDLAGNEEWLDTFRSLLNKWTQKMEKLRERGRRKAQNLTQQHDHRFDGIKRRFEENVLPKAGKRVKQRLVLLERRVRIMESKLHEPKWVHRREKWAFLLGVSNMWVTAATVGVYPDFVVPLYTLKCVLLLTSRYMIYKPARSHYFLADFCYFANALTLIYVYLLPYSRPLFIALFCLTNGPLAWAILTWKNAMVFHSPDKVTSVFIHLSPSVVFFTLRWLVTTSSTDIHSKQQEAIYAQTSPFTLIEALLYSSILYTIWQVVYYICIWRRRNYKITQLNYLTSFTYLVSDRKRTTLIYRLSNVFGPKYHLAMFTVWQLVYTLVTVAVSALFLAQSKLIHMVFLSGMVTVSVWNGAGYYLRVMEVKANVIPPLEKQIEDMTKLVQGAMADIEHTTPTGEDSPSILSVGDGTAEARE